MRRSLDILVLTPTFLPAIGGAEIGVHEIYSRLGARNRVVILTKQPKREMQHRAVPPGFDQTHYFVTYYRDFLNGVSPLGDDFTLEYLIAALDEKDKNLKALMVGKEAVVVGFGNATFQEIAYKAKIHPKRKSSTFSKPEKRALYKAIKTVVESRIKKGGKLSFTDLYGKEGKHVPFVGGHLRDKPCPKCGTTIERLMFGGGPTYLCPSCQK